MVQDLAIARSFFEKIDGQSADKLLTDNKLSIKRDGSIQVCYAPFDHIEQSARLVIVGITPGMTQSVIALNALHDAKIAGKPIVEALRTAKMTASFSGAMRSNLVETLDFIGVADLLKIQSTSSLFEFGSTDMHFTSALRYPVFVAGKNYAGNPSILRTPMLRDMVETHLAEEARLLPNAIWLPLGPNAEEAVLHLVGKGHLSRNNVMAGMPHPSGANAERIAVFTGRKSPSLASNKTNPDKLLQAAERLKKQIAGLKMGEAA